MKIDESFYSCSWCGDFATADIDSGIGQCDTCKQTGTVEFDADFVNGSMRDCSMFHPETSFHNFLRRLWHNFETWRIQLMQYKTTV